MEPIRGATDDTSGGRLNTMIPPVRFAHSRARGPSQSPSHSPTHRRGRSVQITDPLLVELSPTTTLEALTTSSSTRANEQDGSGQLRQSIARADPAERALAIRAATAAKQLRDWYAEVCAWEWPVVSHSSSSTGFEVPTIDEQASKRRKTSEATHEYVTRPHESTEAATWDEGEEYWGGCPAGLVVQRQTRVEAIRDGIEDLDLDDLESLILGECGSCLSSYHFSSCLLVFFLMRR